MPNNYDFSNIRDLKTVEVNPKGWISPLFVEYGSNLHGGVPSYFWRVKGTQHTFIIPILRMDFLSKGDYVKHFEEVLENFREDYLEWEREDFYLDWMKEYKEIFQYFIIK
ncbi:MAG TPA: hypothetical protein P5513_06650 [Candidatus Diapherotrites archaeon]|nr:hypothetical protein [Candidatus Diapherotrites archaeon]